MKEIGAVTIGKLIEAHYEKDEHKFKAYAEFIAEAYKERGEERAERIIRSKIDGSYKSKPVAVALDDELVSKNDKLEKENAELKEQLETTKSNEDLYYDKLIELQEQTMKKTNIGVSCSTCYWNQYDEDEMCYCCSHLDKWKLNTNAS